MPAEPGPAGQRGDPALGVFETLRVRDGIPEAAAAHLARLDVSLRRLYGLAVPATLAGDVRARAARLTGTQRLRVDAIPEPPGLRISLTTSPLPAGPPAPVLCRVVIVAGGLGPDKLRDRAALDTLSTGDVTPLIADADGHVLEAAWGNLWLREGERLITPPADGRLLPGVTRARLLTLAPDLGLRGAEEPVTRERLAAAPAVFITSALRLAVAVAERDAIPGSTAPRDPAEPAWLPAIRAALADGWHSGASAR